MLGKWDNYHTAIRPFGDNGTYLKAASWLGPKAEDWGCGCIWAKQFFEQYRGVDGSGPFADHRINLTQYWSKGWNILCRHVLEHNFEWRLILRNLLESFNKRACIVLFIPSEGKERVVAWERDIPYIALPREEFEGMLAPYLKSTEQAEEETIYFLER